MRLKWDEQLHKSFPSPRSLQNFGVEILWKSFIQLNLWHLKGIKMDFGWILGQIEHQKKMMVERKADWDANTPKYFSKEWSINCFYVTEFMFVHDLNLNIFHRSVNVIKRHDFTWRWLSYWHREKNKLQKWLVLWERKSSSKRRFRGDEVLFTPPDSHHRKVCDTAKENEWMTLFVNFFSVPHEIGDQQYQRAEFLLRKSQDLERHIITTVISEEVISIWIETEVLWIPENALTAVMRKYIEAVEKCSKNVHNFGYSLYRTGTYME